MNKQTLQQFLKIASASYYNGHPLIPDEVFDHLAEYHNFNEVGTKEGDARHLYQLFSLEKFYPADGNSPNRDFANPVHTPKLDGACISAVYIDGDLVQVLTRGNGIVGKDITNKFLDGRLIPLSIHSAPTMQLVLEVVTPKTTDNARNYCAGALNLKSVDDFKTRDLTCVVHGIYPSFTGSFLQDMSWLVGLGMKTVTVGDYSIYPRDGTVVREDREELFEEWGYTNHHPRGAYAIKERREGVETVLRDVLWQVGKTGRVTPVAIFDPVEIDGASISRATLHNIAFIEALDIEIGDSIEVAKMGDVIPGVLSKVA